ncbi:CvpA family protein [Helicobacter mustelae]|uniref:Putative integral membrane protein, Colicin V production protein homolog n=1 Tax=Helicobacter mustelae (strain ATCC 43772 / CCUG 25715 / CIP 103759 / LMG 18044 / NCTC 12198 / R85-136P) TaxID=679897 RepID=D3UIP8_HELM1|nr:CvpA family protein [Helicobacter mustelae]CBG40373.1 putative integral membrane protein, Colicin V production protein homolog [Helicobacter mustelae 12198]SQH71872.1 Putative integral membrane protein [Helicobacter mustelae]STP13011.1 Putative integral membrane protein [Helicobacter mustelae]
MNYIDIILLAIILIVSLKGIFDGFVHELSALIGIIVGIFFASRLASDMAVLFDTHVYHIKNPSIAIILGFVIVLAFFWVAFLLIGFIITKFVRYSGLGILDRILGYCFSCLKIFCILAFIIFALNQIKFIREIDFIKNLPQKSKVYAAMMDTANLIIKFDSPEKITQKLEQISPKLKDTLENTTEQMKSASDQIKESIQNSIKKP